jgi:hypothetical protein
LCNVIFQWKLLITDQLWNQCRLNAWARWAVAMGPHEHRGPILIYVCCVQHVFWCINTDFVEGTNTINICLILSTIYIFIPVSGCVDRGPSALFAPGVYNAVKIFIWINEQVKSAEYPSVIGRRLPKTMRRIPTQYCGYWSLCIDSATQATQTFQIKPFCCNCLF